MACAWAAIKSIVNNQQIPTQNEAIYELALNTHDLTFTRFTTSTDSSNCSGDDS